MLQLTKTLHKTKKSQFQKFNFLKKWKKRNQKPESFPFMEYAPKFTKSLLNY